MKLRDASQVALILGKASQDRSYEADRIFIFILQKSSKRPFCPLSETRSIAYCCHNFLVDMGKQPWSD